MGRSILEEGHVDIAGLEISANKLRAVRLARKGNFLGVAKFAEVPLPSGIIVNGKLSDPKQFQEILSHFLKSNHFSSARWMVSLPNRAVFTTYKLFPEISYEDLAEAVKMNITSIVPGESEKISWGWQEVASTTASNKEVMISSIAKEDLNNYLAAFGNVGVVPIAVEPKASSIARVINISGNILILNLEGLTLTSVISSGGSPRFSRETELARNEKEQFKSLLSEIKRVINYYLTEKKSTKIEKIILDGASANEAIVTSLKKNLEMEVVLATDLMKQQKMNLPTLALYGVGIRTLYEPAADLTLSLLPVSTKEAYEEKRVLMFFGGISNLVVITSILILLVFLGMYLFLEYLQKGVDVQLANFSNRAATASNAEEIADITEVAKKITTEASLESQMVYFSDIIGKIYNSVPSGVTIKELSYSQAGQPLGITGSAESRDVLGDFRTSLAEQEAVESVQIPTSNTDEKNKVNFTLTITLKK